MKKSFTRTLLKEGNKTIHLQIQLTEATESFPFLSTLVELVSFQQSFYFSFRDIGQNVMYVTVSAIVQVPQPKHVLEAVGDVKQAEAFQT